jgi:2-polyprenyl-6-methoxyphenol hydroxylase-like FAD-dependent oxidoreductase
LGDAAYHKGPFLAFGIPDAFRDAALLADALDEGFSGREPLEDALAAYETERNEASQVDYFENTASASFLPLPDNLLRLRAALARNRQDATTWLKARWGMIPAERFCSPENLARIQQAGAEAMQTPEA